MLYCWFQPQKREKFTFIHIKHHYLSHTFIMWWSSSKLESKFDRAISGGNGGIWSLNSNPLHVRIINRRDASLKLINFAPKFRYLSDILYVYKQRVPMNNIIGIYVYQADDDEFGIYCHHPSEVAFK